MKHENILPLLGVWKDIYLEGEDVKYPVAISPWMEDGDLHLYLKNNPNTSVRERLTYVSEISYPPPIIAELNLCILYIDARYCRCPSI